MIRKTVIAILTLLTVTTAAVGVGSLYHDSRWPFLTRWYHGNADSGFVLDVQTRDGALSIKYFAAARKRSPPANQPRNFLGISYQKTNWGTLLIDDGDRVVSVPGSIQLRHVVIPIWYLVALFPAYPIFAYVRGRVQRHRRRRKGLCPACGYDLRGNVSGRCPECGRPISVASAAN